MDMDMENVAEGTDLTTEVTYWIREVEEELMEIDRQQYELIRDRTKFEGTLRWLKGLLESDD